MTRSYVPDDIPESEPFNVPSTPVEQTQTATVQPPAPEGFLANTGFEANDIAGWAVLAVALGIAAKYLVNDWRKNWTHHDA